MLNSDLDIFGVKIIWVGKYRSGAVNVNLKWGISIQDRQALQCSDYIFRCSSISWKGYEGYRMKNNCEMLSDNRTTRQQDRKTTRQQETICKQDPDRMKRRHDYDDENYQQLVKSLILCSKYTQIKQQENFGIVQWLVLCSKIKRCLTEWLSDSVSDNVTHWAVSLSSGQLKTIRLEYYLSIGMLGKTSVIE